MWKKEAEIFLLKMKSGKSIMKKCVVIINGKGGVGKDTLCDIVSKNIALEMYLLLLL